MTAQSPALAWRTGEWRRPLLVGATVSGIALWGLYLVVLGVGAPIDVHAYYVGQYGTGLGERDAYLYSPAFAQALEPLRWLGWDIFREVWRSLEVGALVVMTGPLAGLLLFVQPVAVEVNAGNIHLLLALAIVAGFRWPALWSFVLLTKVTPGVGLLWFAARREWRSLGIALGVTAAIVGVSFALEPNAWAQWISVLRSGQTAGGPNWALPAVPLLVRLPVAAALVVWGARHDYRWTVLVAAFVALPVMWITALSMLAGLAFAWSWRWLRSEVGGLEPRLELDIGHRAADGARAA